MALWLVRAGRHGEFEDRFLRDNRVYLTWRELGDVMLLNSKEDFRAYLEKTWPMHSTAKISNSLGKMYGFMKGIQERDWIVLPSKLKQAKIHFAECTGPCGYDAKNDECLRIYRPVKWLATDIPRSNFDKDILYSLGAFSTICQIKRNDAENRIRAMAKNNWKSTGWIPSRDDGTDDPIVDPPIEELDLERIARDQISSLILAKYKGHGLARLVDAILQSQGYTTYRSPEGPDKGIDILAAPAPMGFGQPRLCVQVKSTDGPVDRPTLDQLIGTMQNVQAQHGLLVSWGGFKASVDKEEATQFFRVRLWDQDDLVEQLLNQYQNLSDDIRAELPLKRVWVPAAADDESEGE